jgi:hypothetical protein
MRAYGRQQGSNTLGYFIVGIVGLFLISFLYTSSIKLFLIDEKKPFVPVSKRMCLVLRSELSGAIFKKTTMYFFQEP